MSYRISLEKFEAVRERFKSGPPDFPVISKELGVSVATVARIYQGKHYYQSDSAERGSHPQYLPTPQQIESECVRLRAARPPIEDDDEANDPDGWPPPAITLGTLD